MRKFIFLIIILIITCLIFANQPVERVFAIVSEADYPEKSDSALIVIDVTDFENPTIVDRVPLTYPVYSCNYCGNCLYTVENDMKGNGLLSIFDCSNPYEIEKISTKELGNAFDCKTILTNDLVYVANMEKGLTIVNISDRINPEIIGCEQCEGLSNMPYAGLWDTFYKNGNIFGTFVDWSDQDIDYFLSFDVSDPTKPELVDQIKTTPRKAIFLDHNGDYAYIGSNNGLLTVEISDPTNLKIVSDKKLSGEGRDIDIYGHYLYINQFYGNGKPASLSILDISNPASPELISNISLGNNVMVARSIQVVDEIAYISTNIGLLIVDVADTSEPVIVNVVPATQRDGYMYSAAHGLTVLKAFNIDQE